MKKLLILPLVIACATAQAGFLDKLNSAASAVGSMQSGGSTESADGATATASNIPADLQTEARDATAFEAMKCPALKIEKSKVSKKLADAKVKVDEYTAVLSSSASSNKRTISAAAGLLSAFGGQKASSAANSVSNVAGTTAADEQALAAYKSAVKAYSDDVESIGVYQGDKKCKSK